MNLKGKRILAIGERDGISGSSIEVCVRSTGAEILYVETMCFV